MKNLKMLLVEIDKLIATILQIRLMKAGWMMTSFVSSHKKAYEKVKEIQPDIILINIGSKKNEDKIEMVKRILQKCDIPVVILTGISDSSGLFPERISKKANFITIPVDDHFLLDTIQRRIDG